MISNQVSCLPVMDDADRLLGIITMRDLLYPDAIELRTEEYAADIDAGDEGASSAEPDNSRVD